MKKRAKLKKHSRIKLKYVLLIFLVYISFQVTYNVLLKTKLYSSNEEFLKHLIQNSNHHMIYEKANNNFVNKITNFITNIDIKKPVTILESMFNYEFDNMSRTTLVFNDQYNPDELGKISEHIKDPNPEQISKPIVYIYNSHQLENYSGQKYEPYNITPNVMMASYLLREKLNNENIPTIAEEANITEFIRINNWDYNYSYVASRYYIEDAIKNNPTLQFFIDIHRDSIKKAQSTVKIQNKNYAKILFVVGLEHKNHQKNLDLANKFNKKISEKFPGLSRGVITKSGPGVDGIYNQDLSPNMILLEIGGQENTIEEVVNTIDAITIILKEHLNER